jgi:hypothetical protein
MSPRYEGKRTSSVGTLFGRASVCLEVSWRATELQELHVGVFEGPVGTFRQRTELTHAQRAIFTQLGIDHPRRSSSWPRQQRPGQYEHHRLDTRLIQRRSTFPQVKPLFSRVQVTPQLLNPGLGLPGIARIGLDLQ